MCAQPENVLLDAHGHARLTDFGFAKRVIDGVTYTMCGTPDYMAPELIVSKGHSLAVDWYRACACVRVRVFVLVGVR